MKNISLLGSTGSIGRNALKIIAANSHRYKVVALSAGRNIDLLAQQIEEFRPVAAAVLEGTAVNEIERVTGRRPVGHNTIWNSLAGGWILIRPINTREYKTDDMARRPKHAISKQTSCHQSDRHRILSGPTRPSPKPEKAKATGIPSRPTIRSGAMM